MRPMNDQQRVSALLQDAKYLTDERLQYLIDEIGRNAGPNALQSALSEGYQLLLQRRNDARSDEDLLKLIRGIDQQGDPTQQQIAIRAVYEAALAERRAAGVRRSQTGQMHHPV